MRARYLIALTAICFSCPIISSAVEEAEETAAINLQSPLHGMALIETLGGLVLILILIFGLGWLLRRFGRLPVKGNAMISIVGGVSLGPRERAVLLQVEDTRLLVGVAPGRVQMLHLLDKRPVKPAAAFKDDDFTLNIDPEIVD